MNITACNACVPANITRIVKEKGLKQKHIAAQGGYSETQFSDMLKGRKLIKACDIIALAGAMGVDAGELFRETEEPE